MRRWISGRVNTRKSWQQLENELSWHKTHHYVVFFSFFPFKLLFPQHWRWPGIAQTSLWSWVLIIEWKIYRATEWLRFYDTFTLGKLQKFYSFNEMISNIQCFSTSSTKRYLQNKTARRLLLSQGETMTSISNIFLDKSILTIDGTLNQ